MARKTKVITVCDRHRGDVEAAGSVEIVIEGDRQRVDLCSEHLAEFRKLVRPWVSGASTSTRGRATARPRKARPSSGARPRAKDTAEVRAWAAKNGFELAERGRIPSSVREAYAAANN